MKIKTIQLNQEWLARRQGRSVIAFTRDMEENNLIESFGRKITKRGVRKLLTMPLAERRAISIMTGDGGGRISYIAKRYARYIQIGCQKFYLTRIQKLLSLFP